MLVLLHHSRHTPVLQFPQATNEATSTVLYRRKYKLVTSITRKFESVMKPMYYDWEKKLNIVQSN